jgi:hypothetical protein
LTLALCLLGALPARADELKVQVAEVGRSVDLARGRQEFITLVLEISGVPPVRLAQVQPLREDFTLLAGKAPLPCRWLRGGTAPDDPSRLRFTLGFSLPPPKVKKVDLRVNLPRLGAEDRLEVRLDDLKTGGAEQQRKGPGWEINVDEFGPQAYTPPALPASGKYISKGGPVDARVFRKADAAVTPPAQAIRLTFYSRSVELYDATLDVSGLLIVAGGSSTPLLSALLKRDPSRSVKDPPYGPFVHAEFYFAVPPKGRATGVALTFHRRAENAPRQPLLIRDLPVPGGR